MRNRRDLCIQLLVKRDGVGGKEHGFSPVAGCGKPAGDRFGLPCRRLRESESRVRLEIFP